MILVVNGQDVCCVEDAGTVDRAMERLEERFGCDNDLFANARVDYRYTVNRHVCDVDECVEALYDYCAGTVSRAYEIDANGVKVGIVPTYAEADSLVNDLQDYLSDCLSREHGDANVQVTTDFSIANVICERADVSTADDLYFDLTGIKRMTNVYASEPVPDSRVTATGFDGYLRADKTKAFGLTKVSGSQSRQSMTATFLLSINAVNAQISYQTVVEEKYSEVIDYETRYVETDALFIGEEKLDVRGENGLSENVYEVAYVEGEETCRNLITSTVIVEPITEVILIGTKPYPSTDPTGFFMWPILNKHVMLSSYFGDTTEGSVHMAVDLAGIAIGEPVYAADGGEVVFADYKPNLGLFVRIRHEDGVETAYAHLNALYVNFGDRVFKGQQIAEVGMTGNSSGSHLHFEVIMKDVNVDPLAYLPKKIGQKD